MQKHLIYLITALVATVALFVARVELIEMIYQSTGFSDKVYNFGLYNFVMGATIGIAWLLAALYYYVIDSVKFDRWFHWLVILIAGFVITGWACFALVDRELAGAGLQYGQQTFYLAAVCASLGVLIFIIASFGLRWWSKNCRHTPIPQ